MRYFVTWWCAVHWQDLRGCNRAPTVHLFIKSSLFRRGSTFITIRFCIACNFFLYYYFLTTCWGLFALALKVFLNHCYFYFHERKVLLPSRKILVMHCPCLQIFYVCACACIYLWVFLRRVWKLAKPNPTMQARASTSLLHEAFSKKILEKFTVVIASWLDCRQLGFTITQKQNDMKNFFVFFEQRKKQAFEMR